MKALLRTTLGAALLWLGLFPTEAHAISASVYDKLFDRADLNHDNFLSLDEFLATQPRGSRWVDVAWRFQYNDENQDNYLDKLEYRASRGGKDGGRPSKVNTFLTADLDHDNALDPSEFALTQPQVWPTRKVMILFAQRDRDANEELSPKEFGVVLPK
ncbi:hypothetical protein KBB96_16290 [Luteolibacter ambystomatis]|uniref:EF-hand domain-containing protein n=1 Tax=Luteolibacter ambystomatis TaxID=2824561 RepID=A0A975IZV9_9BACT|nr:hypothetical protein [Luteolibacter ambystomatis]QUE50415.1 hypothetical protein KBB96_16290 [Luteolibacter ambystomatis]